MLRLVLILQSERTPNARELADCCEVSRRTIYRDLDVLSAAGVPVRYRQDRGGYQIAHGFFLAPTGLTDVEALALAAVAGQRGTGDALGLLRHAREGALKLVQSLPPGQRDRLAAAGGTFLDTGTVPEPAPERRRVHEAIVQAVLRGRQIRLWYRDPNQPAEECTKFTLYRVVFHDGQWSLVGRSSVRRRVEVVRVPWVSRAEVTADAGAVPPRFNLERFLGRAWGVERGPMHHRVWLRFSASAAPAVLDGVWHATQRHSVLPDGRVDLHFVVSSLDEVLRWVLGFGDQVEVLAPEALSSRLYEVASRVARTHQPPRGEDGADALRLADGAGWTDPVRSWPVVATDGGARGARAVGG